MQCHEPRNPIRVECMLACVQGVICVRVPPIPMKRGWMSDTVAVAETFIRLA
eukprot:s1312_g8.t1